MDTGDMINKEVVQIGDDETTGELWDRLSIIGAKLLVKTLKDLENGTYKREKQGDDFTVAPMIKKEMAKIDWKNQSTDHLLQVEFNMKEPVKETISDDLAGYVKRQFDTDYDIYKHIPAPRGIELKHNTAPLQKCLFAQGLCLTTEGLQEYEIYKNKLRLTILRATGTISNPVNPTRGTPAGPPLPTLDLQMQGANTARFTLCFKDTIQEAETCVEKFYGAALLLSADLIDTKLFEINSKEFKLSTIKLDKDDNLVLRFLNKSDKEQLFDFNTELQHSNIYITDAMEQEKKEFAPTKIEPNSFVTLIIKNN